MDPSQAARIILPTNTTSATNPTVIVRDTVVQTNREGEPPEYRKIKTTEQILEPTLLGKTSPAKVTTKTTTTVEEVPTVPTSRITTTVQEIPVTTDYVVKRADEFKPIAVISDTTPINSVNNQIVETTSTSSLTTPGKIVSDSEPVISERYVTTVTEPVTKKIIKTVTYETNK
ncbi:unnamed protein product [Rotaria sordida]|uniref:Uncharacterized protein n=1 Tax=Rotaria sordida TaxID=392033 RepID=A0A819BMJ1_9BILA|nr:unnamed protein product [Rotaria sordida]